jgi:hypothetical protein
MPEPRVDYERSDLPARTAGLSLLGVAGLVVLSLASILALALWFEAARPPERSSPLARTAAAPNGPRLEVNPHADRLAVEAPAYRTLQSYGWSDRKAGLARVPIERAMDLQARAGWPDAEAAADR